MEIIGDREFWRRSLQNQFNNIFAKFLIEPTVLTEDKPPFSRKPRL